MIPAEFHAAVTKLEKPNMIIRTIDGRRLAELMIDHGVGVSHRTVRLPRIDNDYFES